MLDQIKQLFEYDKWALEQEFIALASVKNPGAVKTLAHILAAKQIWLVRLRGHDSSSISTQPDLSFADCRTLADELNADYDRYLSALDETALTTSITYKNTKGDQFATPIGEVLTHIAFHSGYHRGQIALQLRQSGDKAVNTDYISFTRIRT